MATGLDTACTWMIAGSTSMHEGAKRSLHRYRVLPYQKVSHWALELELRKYQQRPD